MKNNIKEVKTKLVRALFFVPGIICFIMVVSYWSGEIFPWNQTGSQQEEALEAIGVDISSRTIVECSDSHGGFHGDGLLFEVITLDDESAAQQLAEKEGWKALPLSENLTALLYGVTTGTSRTGPFLTDEADNPIFPKIQNGYYYFVDRHPESTAPYDDTDVLDRLSFNFTIAIYDTDTDTLYYAKLDT